MCPKIILISLLLGLMNLDTMSIGQFMLHRPLVIGALLGWLFGDLSTGLYIGAVAELLTLERVPMGADIPPNAAISAGIAISVALLTKVDMPGRVLSLALAMPVGFLSTRVELDVRRRFGRLGHYLEDKVNQDKPGAIATANMIAVSVIFAMGVLISFVFIALFTTIIPPLLKILPCGVLTGLVYAYWLLPAVGLASQTKAFWKNV